MIYTAAVQTRDFNLQAEYEALLEADKLSGAVVTFVGRVRDIATDKKIDALYIEHYPGMTESALEAIQQEAFSRFSIHASKIIHRVGRINSAEQIVFVGVTSSYREDAFAACEFIMDYLKNSAPFWKKEITSQGEYWVEAKEKDQKLFERWNQDN
jgi:molybdopterin synthase catalytic subunit